MASAKYRENWSEHQTTMFSSLLEKRKQGKFCDVVLKCIDSEQTFNAHSCVLSAASKVLDKLLNDATEQECMAPGTAKLLVVLPNEVSSSCMESLLNFIYSGNIDLNLPNETEDEGSSNIVESSSDIPLLYSFLKASRCLEIQTLTEHLESAVTLSEMKMMESRDSPRPSRSCTVKAQIPSKLTVDKKKKDEALNNSSLKNTKQNTKKKQVSETGTRSRSHTRQKSGKVTTESNTLIGQEHNSTTSNQIAPPPSAKKASQKTRASKSKKNESNEQAKKSAPENLSEQCNNRHEKFKTRSAKNRHISPNIQDTKEVEGPVSPKGRTSRKLRCPTCQKLFKNANSYEVHMKNHISEIEAALSKTREQNTSESQSVDEENNEDSNNQSSSQTVDSSPSNLERPRRASTAKFHKMMKVTFGVDTSESVENKRKQIDDKDKATSETLEDAMDVDATALESANEEEIVQQIVFEEDKVDEELVVVESENTDQQWTCFTGTIDTEDGEKEIILEECHENDPALQEENGTVISMLEVTDESGQTIMSVTEQASKEKKNQKPKPVENEDGTVNCLECGKAVSHLKTHMKTHAKSLDCQVCGDTFKYRSALKRHMLFHTEGLPCSVCKEKIFSQRDMSKHMAKHNQKKMRTQCPDCKKTFTSDYVMQLHRKTHTGEEKFTCEICSKKFPYKSSLKMHMLLHTGEKPYICSICGKCFVQKIHAREHELQHQGIRREFQCTLCERKFAHKCGLTRHIADIHQKSRPFVCETCGKSFPRKTKLIEHTRMHTGEKPYICEICGVRYKANRSLKCHKKNSHGIFVPDYEVGIWRNGPLPPLPEVTTRPTTTSPKKKIKPLSSFPFPVSSEGLSNIPMIKSDEAMGNDTAEQVDVVTTVSQPSPGVSPVLTEAKTVSQHFTYPIPPANQEFQTYSTMAEVTNFPEPTLPPASTLTKSDPSKPLVFPNFHSQKTFIVPLTSTANPALPVLVDPSPSVVNDLQMPGMMVTYMMPPQPFTIAETTSATSATIEEVSSSIARSASVPPMSTFRKVSNSSNAKDNSKADSPAQPLPGMHTFQPVQFQVATSEINDGMMTELENTSNVPVIVERHQMIQVSSPEEVPAHAEEVTVQQQNEDWANEEYSSDS